MRFCLTCRRLSPGGTLFCSTCGHSWGGRLCPKGHRNPGNAQFCATCGKPDLTAATGYVPLGCPVQAASLLVLAAAVRWVWHHAAYLLRGVWAIGLWGASLVSGVPAAALEQGVMRLVSWFAALYVLSLFLPSWLANPLRKGLSVAAGFALRLVGQAAALVWRAATARRTESAGKAGNK
jgi:hypothetical protein